jgi:hypothetical protein
MTCRKELSRRQNCRYFSHRQDNCNGQAGYSCPTASFRRGLQVFRHLGGKNITQAFIRNVRGLPVDVLKALQEGFFFFRTTVQQKLYSSYCNSILAKSGEATGSVGCIHSSDEVSVMEMGAKGYSYSVLLFVNNSLRRKR